MFPYSRNKVEEAEWKCTGLWLLSYDHPGTSPGPSQTPTPAPLAPALLLSGAKMTMWQCWERKGYMLTGNRTSWDPTLRASAPAPWDSLPTLIGWCWPLSEEKPWLTPGSALSPFNSSPTSYQSDGCQHTLEKDTTQAHVRSSSPTKATRHMQTAQGHSHKGAPLQDGNR